MNALSTFSRLSLVILCLGGLAPRASAQVAEPDPRSDDAFDVMNLLAARGLHKLEDERWNVYGQVTHISTLKLPYSARYTNLNGSPNSLSTGFEHSFTLTATLYAGLGLWKGAQLYAVPELISMHPLSGLKGLGSTIQDFELQKNGTPAPVLYLARAFLRQTIDLGGSPLAQSSDPLQLARRSARRRIVLTAGNLSVIDLFDKNAYAGDLRRQFFNMAFMTYAAFDFAADARGYAWGAALEAIYDDWAIRLGRFTPPKQPNQKALDFRIHKYYGDQLELEHSHTLRDHGGTVRLLAYRNHERMGRFDDASAALHEDPSKNAAACEVVPDGYASTNAAAPDLCWVRKPNVKWGAGLNLEQDLGHDVGLFARAMYADGKTEVYSYTSTDRSISMGVLAKGTAIGRPRDLVGLGYSAGFISKAHARYLSRGGIDGFIGDGALRRGAEQVSEVFYSLSLLSSVWASLDYQWLIHPAYNRDRGPVHILGARLHAEL
jgi:high affinity Mn2+ porin